MRRHDTERSPYGVLIRSNGETRILGHRYAAVVVEHMPDISMEHGHVSQISHAFGMPLSIFFTPPASQVAPSNVDPKKYYEDLVMARSAMPVDSYNWPASLLLMDLDNEKTDATFFSEIHDKFKEKGLGTALVVRSDGKPLVEGHLEAFCKWVEFDLLPLLTDARVQITNQLDVDPTADVEGWKKRANACLDVRQKMLARIKKERFFGWCEDNGVRLELM